MYYFSAAQQTSISKLAAVFQKFKKTVCAPWIIKTKVSSRNPFIGNFFAIESQKISKTDRRNFFGDFPQILDLSEKPLATFFQSFQNKYGCFKG